LILKVRLDEGRIESVLSGEGFNLFRGEGCFKAYLISKRFEEDKSEEDSTCVRL
jgi:hypothetical protein